MKKAFTISEALIAIAIVGVIAAVVVPTINKVTPAKDKATYSKAMLSMQNAVSNVMEDYMSLATNKSALNGKAFKEEDHLSNLNSQAVCRAIADNFNVRGSVNCGRVGTADEPNFRTADGIKYWGLGATSENNGAFGGTEGVQTISFDRDLKKADISKRVQDGGSSDTAQGLRIQIHSDGRITTDENWSYENKLIEKSMEMNMKD